MEAHVRAGGGCRRRRWQWRRTMRTGPPKAATAGYAAANAAMHEAMAIEYSGDPDVDFARAMIPHHEGAIDMAEVLLANGKDPTLRQLAEEIISAQEREIAVLEQWLADHGEA